ncbi:hypothetical protein RhiirA1_455938 [Rhizophagus irregularis]|uniref:F-box domain-containing protein n=1 Tax=Rhizophagus irregularis TaxID=588596 RepID=A0A2N0S1S4_9GLOM|nr:hypothetical protein RhiirA1_455938 [Rhizophagus irregularis]
MACSKVFSGKLPEITDDIVQYFRNDYKTLHSCVLVNRAWCRITIPLLWKEPFSIPVKNYHFIEIYLHNLNDYDKTKLNVCGINNKIFPSKTLFNYPSFIQRINTFKIEQSIEKWITSIGVLKDMTTIVKTLIYKLLFKIFINNEVNLRTFEILITTDQDHRNFNEIFELILQKPNFICNIRNFKLQRIANVRKILQFLEFISLKCNSISSINFQFQKFNDENNLLVKKFLSSIINSQQNLKKISFEYDDLPLLNDLLILNNSLSLVLDNSLLLLNNNINCSNTLKTIIFHKINFKNLNNLKQVFEQLNNLESVHIIYCRLLNYELIQQIINITKPFKLKSLFMDEILQIDSLELLLQKSGDYLENFGFGSFSNDSYIRNELINELKQQLIDLIIKYCTKIELFDLFECNINIIYPKIFNLIQNIDQNLYYLSIDFDDDELLSTNLLLNLGQILPLKLEYLNLSFIIQNINDFEIFLKNSHNTFIKKFLMRNKISKRKIKDILPYIKKYIMKEKRVEYLAIKDSYLEYDLREVKDFRLYNIELRNYDNLYIQAVNYVKEMY